MFFLSHSTFDDLIRVVVVFLNLGVPIAIESLFLIFFSASSINFKVLEGISSFNISFDFLALQLICFINGDIYENFEMSKY